MRPEKMLTPTPIEKSFIPSENRLRFRDALGRFATGITVVTADSARGPLGMTVNSFASVSLDPPLILWSPAKSSHRFQVFESAEYFAVHVLSVDQEDICHSFSRSGHAFETLNWGRSEHGVPLIEGCLSRFECRTKAVHDGGDHVIVVGEVIRVAVAEGEPLLVWRGNYGGFEREE